MLKRFCQISFSNLFHIFIHSKILKLKKHRFRIIRVPWSNSYSSVKIMFLFCVYWILAMMRLLVLQGAGNAIVCFCFIEIYILKWRNHLVFIEGGTLFFHKKLLSPRQRLRFRTESFNFISLYIAIYYNSRFFG